MIVSQTKYCGTSVGPLLVPHSIKRTQLRHSGGLQCPVWSHHSAESSLRGWLCCQVAQAPCPSQGSSVGWSLCQGSVWQWRVALVRLAGGRSVGAQPGCGWGSAELWLPPWGHRCHFPHCWSQRVTDTQRCWMARGMGTTAWGLILNWLFCRKPCVEGGACVDIQGMSCLTFLPIVSHFLSLTWLFSFVGFFAPAS